MSVATAYYRKADGVIMVFDVTNEKSFVNIQSRWMDAIMSEDWLVNLLCNVLFSTTRKLHKLFYHIGTSEYGNASKRFYSSYDKECNGT